MHGCPGGAVHGCPGGAVYGCPGGAACRRMNEPDGTLLPDSPAVGCTRGVKREYPPRGGCDSTRHWWTGAVPTEIRKTLVGWSKAARGDWFVPDIDTRTKLTGGMNLPVGLDSGTGVDVVPPLDVEDEDTGTGSDGTVGVGRDSAIDNPGQKRNNEYSKQERSKPRASKTRENKKWTAEVSSYACTKKARTA